MASLMNLPRESLQHNLNLIPHHYLLNLHVSRRAFQNCVNSKLNVAENPRGKRHFRENYSTAINQLPELARTLESSKHLRQEVLGTLGLIGTSVRRIHDAPTEWDPSTRNIPVKISTRYPASPRLKNTVRERVYSLFSVPKLRHLTLYGFKDGFPDGYLYVSHLQRVQDHLKGREKTSSVEFLSIQDTENDQYEDLREIMRWPKALKGFDCAFGLVDGISSEFPWGVSVLVRVLQPQHASLEQISAANDEGGAGTFGTSFRNFPKLKRLSMPRSFLVRFDHDYMGIFPAYYNEEDYMDVEMKELHLALPPALEDLVLNINDDVKYLEEGERPHADFQELFKQVAIHKQELYPSLKRMVLWTSCDPEEFTTEEIDAKEQEMVDMLEFSYLFKSVGVELAYKVSHVVPGFQNPYVCPDAGSVS